MLKRLLVPLDGSHFSLQALKYANEIAKCINAEIILLQVLKSAMTVPGSRMTSDMESVAATETSIQIMLEQDKKNVTHAKRYLSRIVRGIKSQGITGSYHVVIGTAAQSIMRFAQNENIDLVVMTTHGKGGIERAITGSVADMLIRKSGIPVLVIRPQSSVKKQ